MIFEKLANGITRHAKLVIVAWVVILLAMAYPMSHASDSFNYDSTDVGGTNSESMDGMKVASDHFISISTASLSQNLIITFDPAKEDPSTVMTPFCYQMMSKLADYGKCDIEHGGSAMGMPMESPVNPGEWVCMFNITYNTDISSQDVINDTGNLRSYIAKSVDEVCTALNIEKSDLKTYVTGSAAMSYDTMKSTSRDLSIVDPIAIFMIIILVGLFFRSFVASAAAPSVIGVALAIVLGLIYFVGQILSISSAVEIILIVSMLGAGCDYCIFILSRYREERRAGKEHIEACRQAIMWAGESVATSGLAVMCGFGAMSICSFGMVSNMGIVLAMGILVAIFAALTLMSSVLTLVGDKLFWPTGAASPKLEKGYIKAFGNLAVRYFTKSTKFSIKHAKAIVVATILFTVPMVYVYSTAHDSYDMIGSMMNGESKDGMTIMQDFMGGGNIMPNYVIFETKDSLGTVTNVVIDDKTTYGALDWTPTSGVITDVQTQLAAYAHDLQSIDHIMTVESLDTSGNWAALLAGSGVSPGADLQTALVTIALAHPAAAPNLSKIGGLLAEDGVMPKLIAQVPGFNPADAYSAGVTKVMDWFLFVGTGTLGITAVDDHTSKVNFTRLTVKTQEMALSDNSIAAIEKVTKTIHDEADGNALFAAIWSTGTTAVMVDLSNNIGSEFTKIELLAVVLIVILLFFVMKSYFTPLRSVLTILMSVIWAVAITHLLFGEVLHQGVLWLIPIILLVICLGLGMDYDILLTTRIKEYHVSKGLPNDDAIEQAVIHSGSIITICGIIMGGTFGSLMLASTPMLQQMGFALCFAILVDALIIRTYIVPAAMHIMNEWNWKGPKFLQKGEKTVVSSEENQ